MMNGKKREPNLANDCSVVLWAEDDLALRNVSEKAKLSSGHPSPASYFPSCWCFLTLCGWAEPPWCPPPLVLLVTVEDFDCDGLILIMACCWVVFSDSFRLIHTSLACLPTPARRSPFFHIQTRTHLGIPETL